MKKFLFGVAVVLTGLLVLPTAVQANGNNGGSAVVTVEIQENGDIEVTSTKDLSNVHVAVCFEGEVVIVKFDDLENKVEVFSVEGTLIAVLAHSGNNSTAEAEALLEALGGDVNGNSTGVIVFFDEEALDDCVPEEPPITTTTTVPETTTTTTTTQPPTTTTTEPPVTVTTQPPTTVTTEPPAVVHNCVTPDGYPFSTDVCPVAEVPASVVAPVQNTTLPRTGSATAILAMIGVGLGMTGLILLLLGALLKRREQTWSGPEA